MNYSCSVAKTVVKSHMCEVFSVIIEFHCSLQSQSMQLFRAAEKGNLLANVMIICSVDTHSVSVPECSR